MKTGNAKRDILTNMATEIKRVFKSHGIAVYRVQKMFDATVTTLQDGPDGHGFYEIPNYTMYVFISTKYNKHPGTMFRVCPEHRAEVFYPVTGNDGLDDDLIAKTLSSINSAYSQIME